MKPYNEDEVVRELREAGSRRDAFAEVVRAYSQQLYWQIRRMGVGHDDTDDLLQNTFIKAWTSLDSFRGEARLSTWLYRIALNETLNFLNRQRLQNHLSIDDAGAEAARQLESDPYFDGDETQRQFEKAVLSLPEKQRLVFGLKYFREMKYEEISEITGTSVGALKASYHLAVKKIEEYLGEAD